MPDLDENFCHTLIQHWKESLLINKESQCSGKHGGEECLTFLLQNTFKAETGSGLKCSINKSLHITKTIFSSFLRAGVILDELQTKSCFQDKENSAP